MNTEHAWAAGFIDGEGHFGTHLQRDGGPRHAKTQRLTVRVTVGNVYRQPLDKLHEMYGGVIYLARKPEGPHRGIWHWHLNGANFCRPFTESVLPFLVVKRAEADAFLKLCSTYRPRNTKLTDDEMTTRMELVAQLTTSRRDPTGTPAEFCQSEISKE